MKITLPLPVSDNERLIPAWNMRRLILSKKYRDYKTRAVYEIKSQYQGQSIHNPTFEEPLTIVLKFFLKDKRRDAHDCLKCLLDCLKGIVFTDDKWVLPVFTRSVIDSMNPRVEIEV